MGMIDVRDFPSTEDLRERASDRRAFIIVCNDTYRSKLRTTISDVVTTFQPNPSDLLIIVLLSLSTRSSLLAQQYRGLSLPYFVKSVYSTSPRDVGDRCGLLFMLRLPTPHMSSEDLSDLYEVIRGVRASVRVERLNLASLTFPSLMSSLYRLVRPTLTRYSKVIFNISCADRVAALAVFTLVLLARRKWGDKVDLMHVRAEDSDLLVFKPIIPQLPSKLKYTCQKIVSALSMHRRLTLTELAERIGLTKATVSRALVELERCGVVRTYLRDRVKHVEPGPLFDLAELLL